MRLRFLPLLLCSMVFLSACSEDDDDDLVGADYRAEITRTQYGIPHIKADDWGSLGYGHGYAFAQDNYCMLMEEIVRASGQSLEQLGEASGDEATDFIFALLNNNDDGQLEEQYLSEQPDYVLELVEGYAAGYNRFLNETGVENLAEGVPNCRNASWVREITAIDLWKYFRRIQLQGSSDQGIVKRAILDATGPGMTASASSVGGAPAPVNLEQLKRAMADPNGGSNAIALGRDSTQTGAGMLLGNPHQPWYGVGSWYQVHLTLPGVYDAMGAALRGFPMIGIGFNQDVAWTHTVSYANRFTLFELKLNPNDPMQYEVDGEFKDITSETVDINVTLEDGSTEVRSHTFYRWEYGLIVNLKSAAAAIDPSFAAVFDGWPTANGTVYALRDANLDNLRGIDMWLNIGQATNVGELVDAMKVIGNPLFHTLAADRNGDMFYGELSAIPNVSQAQLGDCLSGVNGLVASLTGNQIIALDGDRSACQWGVDADAPAGSGLYGYENLPSFFATDYAANSNDSFWLSNPDRPLEGFPTVMGVVGAQDQPQLLRTRINHAMVQARLAGTDGLDAAPGFTLRSLQQLMYSNGVYGADIMLDDMLSVCTDLGQSTGGLSGVELQALRGCDQLAVWDRKVDLTSEGAQVFTEFWNEFGAGFNDADLWLVDFDPAQPLTTPRGLDTSNADVRERIIAALGTAVDSLDAAGVGLGDPWGQVQVLPRDGFDIGIHGGSGSAGVFGAISSGLEEGGYRNIRAGNSYVQTVTWDNTDCPVADAIITHSQSIDPQSAHYSDQSILYSNKEWVEMAYCADDIRAAQIGETILLENNTN
jgi:acyl-homoserine-lactone acylase